MGGQTAMGKKLAGQLISQFLRTKISVCPQRTLHPSKLETQRSLLL